jgi:hypothetical protein
VNIPNDASISRTHATFEAHAEAGGVTVCDTSKFGVHVDGVRLDPKNATGDVVLRGEAAPRTCAVALGCAKPAAYEAKLVYTPSDAQPVGGGDDDATTDGDETDAEDRAGEGVPEKELEKTPTDAEDENETRRGAPAPAPARASAPRGADAAEGKATTVFEPLPERARRAADASASAPSPGLNRAETGLSGAPVDFKRFKKQRLGPAEPSVLSSGRRRGAGPAAARRAIVRYADEAYDALPQWEDASVAAAHAAARADARRAEEMFEDGPGGTGGAPRNGAAKKPAPRRRGAAARAR